jgi:hypothetical protein
LRLDLPLHLPELSAVAVTFALVFVGRIAESRSAPLAVAVGALMLAISILLGGTSALHYSSRRR